MSDTPVAPPTPNPAPNPPPFTVGQRIRTRIALDAAEGETPVEVGTEGVITEIIPPICWPILVCLKGHAMARSFAPSELEPLPEPGFLTAVAPESEFVKTVTEPITAGLPDPLSARDNLVRSSTVIPQGTPPPPIAHQLWHAVFVIDGQPEPAEVYVAIRSGVAKEAAVAALARSKAPESPGFRWISLSHLGVVHIPQL